MNAFSSQRAVIYRRVSHDKQLEGHSLGEQESGCHKLIAQRGWRFVGTYTDEAVSARTTDRPAFRQMLADADSGAFSVIVVHKLDRFSRSVTDMLLSMRELERRGVTVVSATEDFDFSTPIGRVLLTLLAAFAQWYIDNLSQEAKKGHEGRFNARRQNGAPPYGYVSVEGVIYWHEEKAQTVQAIFASYAKGYSATEVAEELNRRGVEAPGIGKRKDALTVWSKDTIADILKNRFYIGEIRHLQKRQMGDHEPMISMGLWQSVEAMRYEKARNKRATGRTAVKRIYLCSGLAVCAACGYSMRVASGGGKLGTSKRISYYTCDGRERQHGCKASRTRVEAVDIQIGDYLCSLTVPEGWHERIIAETKARLHQRENGAGQSIAALKVAIKRNKRLLAVADDESEVESLTKEIHAQQAQIKHLEFSDQPVRATDIKAAGKLLSNFRFIWENATLEERKKMVRSIVKTVWVNEEGLDRVEVKPAFELFLTGIKPEIHSA